MDRFWYFLTCCDCCGLIQSKRFRKKIETAEKMKQLKYLNKITPETDVSVRGIASNPLEKKLEEMTDIIAIPNPLYATEAEVFETHGFRIGQFIASGSFAQVYSAVSTNNNFEIACKKILMPEGLTEKGLRAKGIKRLNDMKNELYILKHTNHPHIIKLIEDFFIIKDNKITLYVFMQFAPGGTLSKLCDEKGPFEETNCKMWFAQILSAISYMQKKGIAHRDLKLSNILLDASQDALVTDFGLSKVVLDKDNTVILSKTYCGTPPFMAPEILDNLEYNAMKADIWAMGVILFRLYSNEYPFNVTKNRAKAVKDMKDRNWRFPASVHQKKLNRKLVNIMKGMLEPDFTKRSTVTQLELHPWIDRVYRGVLLKSKLMTSIKKI